MKGRTILFSAFILIALACSSIPLIDTSTAIPSSTSTPLLESPNIGTPTPIYRYEEDAVFCPSDSEQATDFYNQARDADEQEDLESAKELYLKALELDPEYCDAMDNLGVVLRRMGDIEGAISWYQKSIEILPTNTVAHLNLAVAYEIQGMTEEAETEYQTLIEIDPENPEGYFGVGKIYLFTDRSQEAIPFLEQAEELYLQNGAPDEYINDARYLLGAAYFMEEDYVNARDYLMQAYPLMENDPWINYALGVCYLDPALRNLDQARLYCSDPKKVDTKRAICYQV